MWLITGWVAHIHHPPRDNPEHDYQHMNLLTFLNMTIIIFTKVLDTYLFTSHNMGLVKIIKSYVPVRSLDISEKKFMAHAGNTFTWKTNHTTYLASF